MINQITTTKLINFDLVTEKSLLRSGHSVADLGCGQTGSFSFLLSRLVGVQGMVYAVDIVRSNLHLIDKEIEINKIANIKTIWGDFESLNATKIPDNSMDCSYLINSIHQSKNPANTLREAIRITKPNGKLVIIDWSEHASPFGPQLSSRISKSKLVDSSKKNGLYLDNEFSAGQYHFGLVLIKA